MNIMDRKVNSTTFKKHTIILLVVAAVFFAKMAHAANSSGLVNGLWFSIDPVTDFSEVTVYSVVHNQTDTQLQGIATLVVDGEAIGAQEVRVGAGAIEKIGIDHAFTSGSHTVHMSFTAGNGAEVTLSELAAKTIFVVKDTDGDGIQDTTDPDDDNDGILDTEDTEPLVKQIVPRPSVDLSETGRAFLARITGNSEDTDSEEETQTEIATTTQEQSAVFEAFQRLEEARKRGAATVREYEEERRAALEDIARAEEELPTVEGFEASPQEESKKREHQIAAAGASVTGTVLEHGWLFYLHIFILVLSVVHLAWGWFRKRFVTVGEVEE